MTAASAGCAGPRRTVPAPKATAITRRGWKCGVCGTKAGDLVCRDCVGQEAERRRELRTLRLRALGIVRDAAAVAVQKRRGAIEEEARLQKEAAEESRLKEDIRQVTQRVAEERIRVASAAFALKYQREILAATEAHLAREQASAADLKEALLEGLRRHVEDAKETLRQRRWRKVVQLFVLLPVQPSLPSGNTGYPARRGGVAAESGGEGREGVERKGRSAAAVRGVSAVLDLPLPNNGDYTHVPADVVMAGLSLVARLVAGVARCLGLSLPHPLSPAASMSYAAIAVDSTPRERSSQYPLCPLSKLAEIGVMGGASAVINTVGAFETALDLLRSDVVHLCVEGARVPVDRLWPAEALLLNLWELQQHAISELRRLSPMIDVPLPMPRDPSSDLNKGWRRTSPVPGQPSNRGRTPNRPHHDSARTGFPVGPVRGGGPGGPGVEFGRAGARGAGAGTDRPSDSHFVETAVTSGAFATAHDAGDADGGAFAQQAEDDESTYEFVVDDGVDDDVVIGEGGSGGIRGDARGGTEAVNVGLSGSRYAERMRSWGSRLASAGSSSLGSW